MLTTLLNFTIQPSAFDILVQSIYTILIFMSKLMEVTSDLEQNTLISKFTTYFRIHVPVLVTGEFRFFCLSETFSIQLSLREI